MRHIARLKLSYNRHLQAELSGSKVQRIKTQDILEHHQFLAAFLLFSDRDLLLCRHQTAARELIRRPHDSLIAAVTHVRRFDTQRSDVTSLLNDMVAGKAPAERLMPTGRAVLSPNGPQWSVAVLQSVLLSSFSESPAIIEEFRYFLANLRFL